MENETIGAWGDVINLNRRFFKVSDDGTHLVSTKNLQEKCTMQEVFSISTAHL